MVNTRSSSHLEDSSPSSSSSPTAAKPRRSPRSMAATPTSTSSKTAAAPLAGWHHTPSRLTLIWMAVSLPLVIWDTLYVLLRPLTMEGGSLYWPLWVPYRLYGQIDHVYGWVAYNARDGFTAAQGSLNAIETAMYLFYLYEVSRANSAAGAGTSLWDGSKVLTGRAGAKAVLVGFSAAVMTFSKTVLYWANEYFSGFRQVGHNTPFDLFFLWIVPNTPWLIFSACMAWDMGHNIIDGLVAASPRPKEE